MLPGETVVVANLYQGFVSIAVDQDTTGDTIGGGTAEFPERFVCFVGVEV